MKPWLKALLWAMIGGGVGFFAGEKVGEKIVKERMENNSPKMSPEEKERFDKLWALIEETANNPEILEQIERACKNASNSMCGMMHVKFDHMFDQALDEYRGHRMTDAESAQMFMDEIDSHMGTVEEINQFLNQKGIQPATDEDPMPETPEMPSFSGDVDGDSMHVVPQLHPTQILPEIVTEEEYYQNEWEFEEERLVYYEGDEVLFNTATQTTIDYPENVLGVGTLAEFRAGPGYPKDTIFVVNEMFGTRFRVDRVTEAFCDEVGETTGPEDDMPDEADENPHPSDEYWDDV